MILILDKVISGSDSKKGEIWEKTIYCYECWLVQMDFFFFSLIQGTPTITAIFWVLKTLNITHIHEMQTDPFCFLVPLYLRQ